MIHIKTLVMKQQNPPTFSPNYKILMCLFFRLDFDFWPSHLSLDFCTIAVPILFSYKYRLLSKCIWTAQDITGHFQRIHWLFALADKEWEEETQPGDKVQCPSQTARQRLWAGCADICMDFWRCPHMLPWVCLQAWLTLQALGWSGSLRVQSLCIFPWGFKWGPLFEFGDALNEEWLHF